MRFRFCWAKTGIRHRKSRLKSNIDRSINRSRAGTRVASQSRLLCSICSLQAYRTLPSGKVYRDTVSAALRRATAGAGPRCLRSSVVRALFCFSRRWACRFQLPFRGFRPHRSSGCSESSASSLRHAQQLINRHPPDSLGKFISSLYKLGSASNTRYYHLPRPIIVYCHFRVYNNSLACEMLSRIKRKRRNRGPSLILSLS